jgi:hypothetical protein
LVFCVFGLFGWLLCGLVGCLVSVGDRSCSAGVMFASFLVST